MDAPGPVSVSVHQTELQSARKAITIDTVSMEPHVAEENTRLAALAIGMEPYQAELLANLAEAVARVKVAIECLEVVGIDLQYTFGIEGVIEHGR